MHAGYNWLANSTRKMACAYVAIAIYSYYTTTDTHNLHGSVETNRVVSSAVGLVEVLGTLDVVVQRGVTQVTDG